MVGDDSGPSDKSPVSMNCEATSFEETEELPLTSLAPHQYRSTHVIGDGKVRW